MQPVATKEGTGQFHLVRSGGVLVGEEGTKTLSCLDSSESWKERKRNSFESVGENVGISREKDGC